MAQENTKYDESLWTIAKQCGGFPQFLTLIACFLKRRTDFFSGASQNQWETLLLKTFRKEHENYWNKKKSNESESKSESKSKSESEINTLKNDAIKKTASLNKATTASSRIDEGLSSKPIQIAAHEKDTEEVGKLLPNAGNGCTLSNYSWTQTLSEIELKVPLNVVKTLSSRDVNVNITKKSLSVGIKGQKPIVDGELCEEIKPDESTWMLQDGKIVSIILEKRNKDNWWDRLIITDPIIAIRKIEPELSKLSDLDDSTRATVEKMLYDQRQKQLDLTNSEVKEKIKILENFKKTHPELDFSKCKF